MPAGDIDGLSIRTADISLLFVPASAARSSTVGLYEHGLLLLAGVIGAILVLVVKDLVSKEVQGWLDLAPRGILRLAARRVPAGQRETVYRDEFLPGLARALVGLDSRPISRLMAGIWYALRILIAGTSAAAPEAAEGAGSASGELGPAEVFQTRSERSSAWDWLSGEQTIAMVRRHPVVLLRPVAVAVSLLIAASAVSAQVHNDDTLTAVIWLAWGVLLAWLMWRTIAWTAWYFVVTQRFALRASGIVSRKVLVVPLSKVRSVGFERSALGRKLSYGTVTLDSGHKRPALALDKVPRPEAIFMMLSDLVSRATD